MRAILKFLLVPLFATAGLAQSSGEVLARYADWKERDAEGRWVLFEEAVLQNPQELNTWVEVFAGAGAWEELTWLALVRDGSGTQAAAALVENDAPQWIAVEAWRLGRTDSHTTGSAKTALTAQAGLFLAWANAHAEDLGAPARKLVGELEAAQNAADPDADWRRYRPPLHAREPLRILERAAAAEPFGDRRRAVTGVVYHHQVLRAIATLRMMAAVGPEVLDGLLLAALGAEPSIAREACLSFGHFGSEDVPMDVLFALAEDTDRDASVRDAAFLAATYGPPIPVYVRLHEVVRDPGHANWEAAVSRLAERGDGFTQRWLADLDPRVLSSTRRLHLETARESVRALAAQQLSVGVWGAGRGQDAAALLERAAFAELEGSPIADALVEWTVGLLRELPAPEPTPGLPGDEGYVVPAELARRFAPGELEARARTLRQRASR